MGVIVGLLCLGQVVLAACVGWLWLTVDELVSTQRALRLPSDAAADTFARIRHRREQAEAQLRSIERRW